VTIDWRGWDERNFFAEARNFSRFNDVTKKRKRTAYSEEQDGNGHIEETLGSSEEKTRAGTRKLGQKRGAMGFSNFS